METKDRIELVVRTAAKLSREDRERAAERILEETPVRHADKRFARLLGIAEETTGHTMTRSRDFENVSIRRMVAFRMREEGFSLSDIARAMGMHHSTILHYVHQMNDIFDEPIFFASDILKYIQFSESVEEADRDVE